jgi:hypothetical protein
VRPGASSGRKTEIAHGDEGTIGIRARRSPRANGDGDFRPTGGAGSLILEGLNIETCPLLTPVWLLGRACRYVLAG